MGTRCQGQRSVSEKETLTDHQGRASGDACLATDVARPPEVHNYGSDEP